MKYKQWFASIDDIINNTNYSYDQALETQRKRLYQENRLYGVKPIYIKEIDRWYLPEEE